jgi:mRNA-degrading endonuclease toxin of MazEF toxin-antitoxin module
MQRGDIDWVDIPARNPAGREIAKARPCVVVGVPALNLVRSTVLMVPLSSNNKAYPPVSIRIASAGAASVAVCDQLLAVDKKRIRKLAGKLTAVELDDLDQSLRQLMGL